MLGNDLDEQASDHKGPQKPSEELGFLLVIQSEVLSSGLPISCPPVSSVPPRVSYIVLLLAPAWKTC